MSDKIARVGFVICLLALWALLPESCTQHVSEGRAAPARID